MTEKTKLFFVLALALAAAVGAFNTGIGVNSVFDAHAGSARHHPHGTAMSILARELAPNAALYDFRVLNEGGSGTSEDLTRGLDQALFGADTGQTNRPLVINLSLGWAAELGRPAAISGGTCFSYEDSFGAPMRYLLDVARRMDDLGERRVFVSAASGNRPLPVDPNLFPAAPAGAPNMVCSPAPGGNALFYPGEWHRIDSCRPSDASGHRVAFAVGAIDDGLNPSGIAIADAETPLVAPGQHVYAAHSAAASTLSGPTCGGGPDLTHSETLPRAFTGSSVSAALVAGAAARVQDQLRAAQRAALDRDALARLIYLTGRSLCRDTSAGVPVRVLDVQRLDRAVAACPGLITCADSLTGHEPIAASHLSTCAAELVACGLESSTFGILDSNCASPRTGTVTWPASYHASRTTCYSTHTTAAWQDASSCVGTCAFEKGTARAGGLAGSAAIESRVSGLPGDVHALKRRGLVRV